MSQLSRLLVSGITLVKICKLCSCTAARLASTRGPQSVTGPTVWLFVQRHATFPLTLEEELWNGTFWNGGKYLKLWGVFGCESRIPCKLTVQIELHSLRELSLISESSWSLFFPESERCSSAEIAWSLGSVCDASGSVVDLGSWPEELIVGSTSSSSCTTWTSKSDVYKIGIQFWPFSALKVHCSVSNCVKCWNGVYNPFRIHFDAF